MITFEYLFLYFYVIFNGIKPIETVPNGFLVGATYGPGSSSNSLFKINPLSGEFTLLGPLTNYRAYDVTYDFNHKTFYVFGSEAMLENEAPLSVAIVNPFNGTTKYRTITIEYDAELFGLRVDSSTRKL
jgi:hypothetical protein